MQKNVYVMVFDGLADWEPVLATCEFADHEELEVVTVGFDDAAIRTMGGFRVLPDITLAEIEPERAAAFLLPGGDRWKGATSYEVIGLLRELHAKEVPIGAICGATLELARAGLLDEVEHTSNALEFLKTNVPSYRGEARYVNRLAAGDRGIVTASGLGYVEFAVELFRQMKLLSEEQIQGWYRAVKHGETAQ